MELTTTYLGQGILVGFALTNLWAFIVVAYDKRKSSTGNHTERTPEGLIFLLAAAFGSIGVFLGMHIFHHKTRKWYFQIGIPLLIIQNLAAIYLVWTLVQSM